MFGIPSAAEAELAAAVVAAACAAGFAVLSACGLSQAASRAKKARHKVISSDLREIEVVCFAICILDRNQFIEKSTYCGGSFPSFPRKNFTLLLPGCKAFDLFLYRSISVFQSNQTLVNGEYFFDYIQHYAVIYERLFREGTGLLSSLNKINGISLESNVVKFLNTYAHSYRVGDKYLRNLFECMLLFYFDKFGDNNFSEFMTKAFLWVYRLRFEYQRISFKTIEDAALSKDGLLTHIEKSITPAQVMRFIPKLGEIKFDNIDKKIKEIWSVKDYAEK